MGGEEFSCVRSFFEGGEYCSRGKLFRIDGTNVANEVLLNVE